MARPFGGHPTFAQYLQWAKAQGCTIQTGVIGVHGVTKIVSPDGKRWVIEAETQQSSYLVPTTIARLDRRLGLKSPWFSID